MEDDGDVDAAPDKVEDEGDLLHGEFSELGLLLLLVDSERGIGGLSESLLLG